MSYPIGENIEFYQGKIIITRTEIVLTKGTGDQNKNKFEF